MKFALVMFVFAALMAILGVSVLRGQLDLLEGYYRTKVEDKSGFNRDSGKVFLLSCVPLAITGVVSLTAIGKFAPIFLLVGLGAVVVLFWRVCEKYNVTFI